MQNFGYQNLSLSVMSVLAAIDPQMNSTEREKLVSGAKNYQLA